MIDPVQQQDILNKAQMMVDFKQPDAALHLLKSSGLKNYIILQGRIVSEDDKTEPYLNQFLTVHPQMIQLKDDVRKFAKEDDEVLICGPTGTGKEILAHALHGIRTGNFLALNCAGLPEALIESELFGHVKGSFTGADRDTPGMIMAAKHGTLFLDEISELPLTAQGKLLRVIQSRKVRQVGSTTEREVSCRFVFATNRCLKEMCAANLFRIDLHARIQVFELYTLGLKDRYEDLRLILQNLGAKEDLIEYVMKNPQCYPYNVRSLQALVRRHKVLGRIT